MYTIWGSTGRGEGQAREQREGRCWGFLLLTFCFTPHIYIRVWLCILFSFCTDFLCFCGKATTAAIYFVNAFSIFVKWPSCLMHFSHWLFNSTFVTCNAFYFYCFSLQSFTVFFSGGKTTNDECDPTARSHKCWLIGIIGFTSIRFVLSIITANSDGKCRNMACLGLVL